MKKYGREFMGLLLILQYADLKAHSPGYCTRKMPILESISRYYKDS